MAMNEGLLKEFDHEMDSTRRTLERVPFDKSAWKPHTKPYSLGALAGIEGVRRKAWGRANGDRV